LSLLEAIPHAACGNNNGADFARQRVVVEFFCEHLDRFFVQAGGSFGLADRQSHHHDVLGDFVDVAIQRRLLVSFCLSNRVGRGGLPCNTVRHHLFEIPALSTEFNEP
jgi:hypothetical protein